MKLSDITKLRWTDIRSLIRRFPVESRVGLGVGAATILAFLFSGRSGTPPGMAASEHYISTLNVKIQSRARQFIINAYRAGIDAVITSGTRGNPEQAQLYEQGRTTPGNIVTNAPPGTSWHNYGLAFDVAILVNGKPTWPDNSNPVWQKLGAIGAKLGLEHGLSFGDAPHFDYHPNLTIAQARAGKTLA